MCDLGTVTKIVLAGLMVAGLCVLAAMPNILPSAGAGFGPEWQCQSVPKGGQICLRRPLLPAVPPDEPEGAGS